MAVLGALLFVVGVATTGCFVALRLTSGWAIFDLEPALQAPLAVAALVVSATIGTALLFGTVLLRWSIRHQAWRLLVYLLILSLAVVACESAVAVVVAQAGLVVPDRAAGLVAWSLAVAAAPAANLLLVLLLSTVTGRRVGPRVSSSRVRAGGAGSAARRSRTDTLPPRT